MDTTRHTHGRVSSRSTVGRCPVCAGKDGYSHCGAATSRRAPGGCQSAGQQSGLSLIHISEPTRRS
eukprot:18089-Prymnesium_polylepis.1